MEQFPIPTLLTTEGHVRHTKMVCPLCEYLLDSMVELSGEHVSPSLGDVALCFYCAGMLVWSLEGYRPLSKFDREDLIRNHQEVWKQVQSAQVEFCRFQGIPIPD